MRKTFIYSGSLIFNVKMADNEKGAEKRVLARVIIEMLGAPQVHIEKALKDYVEEIGKSKDWVVKKQEIAPAEAQKELFSVFAELEIDFKDPHTLMNFCFDSMPSSVDILEPDKINIDAGPFADMLNDLQARLHNNDMVIKTLRAKNQILDKNAKKILRNFISSLIGEKEISMDDLSKKIGIKSEHLKLFLDELVKEGKLEEKEGRYGKPK